MIWRNLYYIMGVLKESRYGWFLSGCAVSSHMLRLGKVERTLGNYMGSYLFHNFYHGHI